MNLPRSKLINKTATPDSLQSKTSVAEACKFSEEYFNKYN